MVTFFFFFNDTATTEIYTLSLHDALPISSADVFARSAWMRSWTDFRNASSRCRQSCSYRVIAATWRSEEHTSELQSRSDLVCRLLLEKKKNKPNDITSLRISQAFYAVDTH